MLRIEHFGRLFVLLVACSDAIAQPVPQLQAPSPGVQSSVAQSSTAPQVSPTSLQAPATPQAQQPPHQIPQTPRPSSKAQPQTTTPSSEEDEEEPVEKPPAQSPQIPQAQQPVESPRLPVAETAPGWAGRIYSELQTNELDPARVYRIRDAALDREDLHVNFEDGLIAFTKAIDGRITGAFFEGHGEVLLIPPDRVERWSLGQFTGSAILEEQFTTAYLRFNDDTATDLEPWLRTAPPEETAPFLEKWSSAALNRAPNGSMRLLSTFVNSEREQAGKTTFSRDPHDRLFYARLGGERVGVFDVYYDTLQPEQIVVAHLAAVKGLWYYDVWTSFPSRSARNASVASQKTRSATILTQAGAEAFASDPVRVSKYSLRMTVSPPHSLEGDATLDVEVSQPGNRFLRFELSRFLKVGAVTLDGKPVDFIQNQALQGSELARRGNDVVGVVLPRALAPGEHIQLRFTYSGDVLAEAGGGLMYVGARGIWYPNRGLAMSNFDMEFRYPADYTLLATGRREGNVTKVREGQGTLDVARWVTDRPIPFAGFNLGKYEKASAKAGNVTIESYAGYGMESTFKRRQTVLVLPSVRPGVDRREAVVVSETPTPTGNAKMVADNAAKAVDFLSARLGPFPYNSLALTQMPGGNSQGWPGLIYLSSYVFLSPEDRAQTKLSQFGNIMFGHVMEPHEIGHQWLGDLLIWKSYREQWLVEALSNYCALMMLEEKNSALMRDSLEHYRQALLEKNAAGAEVGDAGPVTLGVRLNSSRNPDAYDTVSYGRGTWLFHMLREMLLNPGPAKSGAAVIPIKRGSPDEPFFVALRKVRQRFEGKEITTHDLQQAFEEDLPRSLWFEGRKSLDWFFDGWVNGVSIPNFELTDVKFSDRSGSWVASGKIAQKNAPDTLVTSVPIYGVEQGNNVLLGRVFVEGAETSFRFVAPRTTKRIVLDPYGTVLSRP